MAERNDRRRPGFRFRGNGGLNTATEAVPAASLGALPHDPSGGTPVFFIDGGAPDAGQLAAGVSAGTLAVVLDPKGDGPWRDRKRG
jgi:hypothetical protein